MKKKGFTLVELLVVIAIIAMLLAILMPALGKVRTLAYRLICGTNLGGLGKSISVYSGDYAESYPLLGSSSTRWQPLASLNFDAASGLEWDTVDIASLGADQGPAFVAQATITSCMYLLVKYSDVGTGSFVCKATSDKRFELALANPKSTNTALKDVTQCWDFGPCGTSKPWQFCSYVYQQPYKVTTTSKNYPASASSPAGIALMADRNPWINNTHTILQANASTGPILLNSQNDVDSKETCRLANSKNHGQDGQNVLFSDMHVSFETVPFVGVDEDNIYTPWRNPTSATRTTLDNKTGVQPSGFVSTTQSLPQNEADSFLMY